MAEGVVSTLIDKLIFLLSEEATLLQDIHEEVADIKDELESIRSFLKDADARATAEEDISEGVKTWVKQVREGAFGIDVFMDEYLLHVAQHHHPHPLQKIKALLQKIKERSEKYGFQSTGLGSSSSARNVRWHDPRKDSLYLDDRDVVGIESPRDELIDWLVEGLSHRTVISVVGMGGLGKTTLVKKVYDHQMVRGYFDCHAWIPVSQSYNIKDLLRSIIKQFHDSRKEPPLLGIDAMEEESLVNKLREYLWQKREVASFYKKSSPVHVYELQALAFNKAWELFCKRAFQFDFGGQCPQALKNLSIDIVKKCEGLPLAIVAIGGLLSTKDKTVIEWQNLHDSLGFEFGRNPHLAGVNKILSLSYEDLPYNLKSCFLYLGMYPEDYPINSARLIRQWIAEGFVKEIEGKTLEQVSQEYLIELIHRNLVQVSKADFDGKVRQCRLHDLLREIILQKMKDLSFCYNFSKHKSSFEGLTRRMSVDRVSYAVLKGFEDTHIHSLLLFNLDELPKFYMSTFCANFKLLKVMDFEDAPLDCIPEDVGNLFHLRYLSLRNTKVKMLPKSIGKLQNLETLDLKQSLVFDIPVEINMLHKLRHLIAYHRNNRIDFSLAWEKGVKIQKGVGCLKNLQKLCIVELNHGGVDLIEELGKLRQLRRLGIKNVSKETMMVLCASIEKLNHLESLYIASIREDEIIDLQSISSPPQCLQRLCIIGCLEKLLDWIPKLQHLATLTICWSRLNEDPLEVIQNLPSLWKLRISYQAYNGEQLHFKVGGFPKLKELCLVGLNAVHSLFIDEEALPLLEDLLIGLSPLLKEVPFGIQHLRNLKVLRIVDLPKELEESLDPEQGSNYWIVEHVPAIYLHHKVRTGIYGYDTQILRS
uniref:Uncharacterized protein n=1 Tax=Quercus lobata TaxID=97700 RepID=A0A7N2LC51_QUELO